MFMRRAGPARRRARGSLVALVDQNGFHVHVLRRAQLQGDQVGCLQPLPAIAACQRQQSEACPVAMLGVTPLLDQSRHQAGDGNADALPPMDQALGRPLQVSAMRRRQVGCDCRKAALVCAALMRCHTLAAVQQLDCAGGDARFEQPAQGGRLLI